MHRLIGDPQKLRRAVHEVATRGSLGKDRGHRTIFEETQLADLPMAEKSETMQFDNAFLLVTAGFETTGSALGTATYHLLANPKMLDQLKTELRAGWPDPAIIPLWSVLERLPYLKAVLQEALRMSLGVSHRLTRVNHQSDMQYGDWIVPKGVEISMTQRFILCDPVIFPEPTRFDPNRWLQGEASKQLEKHLVSFSRGARGCVGIQ